MEGFLTFGGDRDQVHLLSLPRTRFTFGRDEAMDLTISVESLSGYCGSLVWDDSRGSWVLQTDAGARGSIRLNDKPVSQASVLLDDGAVISAGIFTMRFDLLPEIPRVGGQAMRVIPLTGSIVRLGRGNEEGDPGKVVLDHEDGGVSRLHAALERETDGSWYIKDHSHSGTELNGQAFQREKLVIGDRFRMGHYVFEFTGRSIRRLTTFSGGRMVASALTRLVGKGKCILHEVSMDVPAGSFVGLLGGSGQGKSTLMTALCGLNPATTGTVLWDGLPLGGGSAPESGSRIGFVPQDDIVHRDLTVREAITFSARLRLPDQPSPAQVQALVQATARRLSLDPFLDRKVSLLSGGQRKRVSIATEMLVKPSVLFLDEPSSGLDPATEGELMEFLRELAGPDCTVICTTHVLDNAYVLDRVAFVQGGRVVFYGLPDHALQFFGHSNLREVYKTLKDCRGEQEQVDSRRTAGEWEAQFQQSAYRPKAAAAIPLVHDPGAAPLAPRPGIVSTLRTLLFRQWAILKADPLNLGFLIAQSVVIALLLGWVAPSDSLRSFLSVVAVLWFGCSNAAQQIVAEVPIFCRERVCGLGIHVYLQSKLVFTMALTAVQALILFGLVTAMGHVIHHEPVDEAELRRDDRLGGGAEVQEIQVEETPGRGASELRRLFGFDEAAARPLLERFAVGVEKDRQTGAPLTDEEGRPISILEESRIVLGSHALAYEFMKNGISLKSTEARGMVSERLTREMNLPPARPAAASTLPSPAKVWLYLKLIQWFGLRENFLDSAAKPKPDDLKDPVTNLRLMTPALPLFEVVLIPVLLKLLSLLGGAGCGVALGLMISSLVRSPVQAVMWVPLILIPQILFGGYVVTRPEMTAPLRLISNVVPSAAAQRIAETGALYGQSVPGVTNRTRIPTFLELTQQDSVTWIQDGVEQTEDSYERLSPSNTAFQNLVVNPAKTGQRHIETNDAGEAPGTVKRRADIAPYRQGTRYTDLRPALLSSAVLLSWMAVCYLISWRGLRRKKSG